MKFYEQFGEYLKRGIIEEFILQPLMADILRFPSARSDGMKISFKDYVQRHVEQDAMVYYAEKNVFTHDGKQNEACRLVCEAKTMRSAMVAKDVETTKYAAETEGEHATATEKVEVVSEELRACVGSRPDRVHNEKKYMDEILNAT